MQGIGYGQIVPQWDSSLVDSFLSVDSDEATFWRKQLAKKEGLYVGFSAAANVCASVKLIEKMDFRSENNVVTILCDTGLKY